MARRLLTEFAGRPGATRPRAEALARLTTREAQVLALVAHGLTNTSIARHLVISEATVKTHVGRILAKLELHGRAQAVAAAYRGGLVGPRDTLPAR